jgi:hypothetical protein
LALALAVGARAAAVAGMLLCQRRYRAGGNKYERNKRAAQVYHDCHPGISWNWRTSSFKLDGALDLDRQTEALDAEQYLGRQGLIAFEPAAGDGRAYRLLDFALRRDTDFLQKLAYTDIENILIHDRLSKVPER